MPKATSNTPIRIASRGSRLALWQAEHVAARLQAHGHATDIQVIKTTGDRVQNIALQGQSDQGFFTKEIERAVLQGEADLAVHSLKDLPTRLPDGLDLVAVPEREVVEDVLLVRPEDLDAERLFPVRGGGSIGATSLRRRALLSRFAPDLQPELLRGNVPTRLDRLRRGDFAAILLARAGLRRLGSSTDGIHAFSLNPELWIPAPGQAALGIEARTGSAAGELTRQCLDHPATHTAVGVERALMARFEAGCHAPFAAWALLERDTIGVHIGCAMDTGQWVDAAVEGTAADIEDQAMAALDQAKAGEPTPPRASPCRPITSF